MSSLFSTLRRDLDFLLYDVMEVERLCERPRFCDHSRATFDAMIGAALRLAEESFESHAAAVDEKEPTWDGDHVHLIDEVGVALRAFVGGGYLSAAFSEEDGGLGLPYVVSQAMMSIFYAANPSTAAYPLLTAGAANLLRAFGSTEQKARFMRPMLEGRFFGTMCLSEPPGGLVALGRALHGAPTGRRHPSRGWRQDVDQRWRA